MTRQKLLYLVHYYVKKAGFLMTRPKKSAHLMHYFTFRSSFSHDVPKTLIFDALLRFEAGFLMTRQKRLYLVH